MMSCESIRDQLPGLLYGDLEAADAASVKGHLQACPVCRREYAALKEVHRLLDGAPVPVVAVDVPRMQRQVADQQHRRLRRGRLVSFVCVGAAAAVFLLAFGLHLEVRLEGHQAVIRWGLPPVPAAPSPAPITVVRTADSASPQVVQQLQVLSEIVQGLAAESDNRAAELDARDQQQQTKLARLQTQLDALQRQTTQQWLSAEQDVAALSAGLTDSPRKGTVP
jgi:anti-sigma factor RsiW